MNTNNDIALEAKNVSKKFGDVIANNSIDLTLHKGEVLAILGENGCGKTTLINILSGVYYPDSGHLFVNGKKVNFKCPADAYNCGIGVVHQHFSLINQMTLFENILAGMSKKIYKSRSHARKMILEVAAQYGFELNLDKKICNMSMSEKQIVEIMKLLVRGVSIFIFDEPTTVLTSQEIDTLFAVIRKMKSEGKSVIIITHKLNEIMEISDRTFIMRKGSPIETIETINANPHELAEKMVGEALEFEINREIIQHKNPRLVVDNISCVNDNRELSLRNVSFNLYGGEILGIAGISGNGQKELCEALAGVKKPAKGNIIFCDGSGLISIGKKTPLQRDNCGVKFGFIPEDRMGIGLIPDACITDNVMIRNYRESKGPFIFRKKSIEKTKQIIKRYKVSVSNSKTPVKDMSGGNIQKVLFGREISYNPSVLIACYPVRGLDIITTYSVYDILNEQKHKGVAVIFVGEDLDVLMNLCDRIMVLSDNTVSGIINPNEVTKEEIGLLMTNENKEDNE